MEGAHRGADAAAVEVVGGGRRRGRGIGRRRGGGLQGVDAADAGAYAAAAEALSEEVRKGADGGFEEVGFGQAEGIGLARGAHRGKDAGVISGLGGKEELGFGEERVYGVDENVGGVVGKEARGGGGVDEAVGDFDADVRVDVAEETGGGGGLGLAEGGVVGEGMAVEVGGAQDVEVGQDQRADGAAGQGFGGGRADGAESGDEHARAAQAGDGRGAEELEGALVGGFHGEEA